MLFISRTFNLEMRNTSVLFKWREKEKSSSLKYKGLWQVFLT